MTLQNQKKALATVISLFFIWGFITELDGAMIPYLKDLFTLSDFQSQLVQLAFFIAFFIVSVPSSYILEKIGYRRGISLGLGTMGLGSLLFIGASELRSYPFFLSAIFILAAGVTLLQVAANPYVTLLGPEDKGSQRLNFAQGFNSLAKVLAPIFGGYFILKGIDRLSAVEKAGVVQIPYLVLGTALILLALVFLRIDLPSVSKSKASEKSGEGSYFDFPHLLKGAIAIFFYVGLEVAIASFLVLFATQSDVGNISKDEATLYLSLYWLGLMIGRLSGAMILNYISANRLLATCAIGGAICISTVLLSTGMTALCALVATGLFHSIMWSNIFALSIKGLGTFTPKGSGLLVMAIVGGAIIPPVQGLISDAYGRQESFALLLIGYAYILYFGVYGYRQKHTT